MLDKQHPCKRIRVDEDSALANSIYVTNLIVDKFKKPMETTSGDASWLNWNNEIHNRSIHNMVIAGLLDGNQQEKKGSIHQKHQKSSTDTE